jgi:outer membrane receptor protein involved in Fe transport
MIAKMTNYCLRSFVLLLVVMSTSLACFAQGSIKGRVYDKQTGEPLSGATVHLEDTKFFTMVNLDGSYSFKNVHSGHYKIEVSQVGYKKMKDIETTVEDNKTVKVADIVIEEDKQELTSVIVTEKAGGRSDKSVRTMEKNAATVQNILSEHTIQLLPDITVGSALQRISGVSVQRSNSGEGRYAIIRGMDQRYNNTLVNGVKIPSPDSKYRYVPMDMFPSEMLDRLEVIKSLTPSMEADAVGGTLNLVMKSAPQKFVFNANVAGGFSTLFSSSRPFTAFDHGAVNSQTPAEIHGGNYSATQNDFSKGNLNYTSKNMPLNTTAGFTIGGRTAHQKLGIILSGSMQNMYRGSNSMLLLPNAQPQVVTNPDGSELYNQSVISDLYQRKYSTQTTRFGLHNKIDYVFNDRNKISLYNMYVHMNEFQTRETYDSVYLNHLSDNLMRSRLQKQSIYNSTLQGDHVLSNVFRINWIGSYAIAKSAVPDLAEYDYQSNRDNGQYTYITQTMSRDWQRNTDKDLAGYLNMFYTPTIAGKSVEFDFGGMYRHKSRDNYYNPYSLKPAAVNGSSRQIWTSYNNATYDFLPGSSMDNSTNPNTYISKEDVSAGYAQFKFNLSKNLSVLGGARIEHTEQNFNTLVAETSPAKYGTVKYTDLLPSLHLKYAVDAKSNIRLSYFRSIIRPDFYEIIPTEIDGETFNIKGNDSLKHSIADNLDLRYEFYPGGADQFLVGAFYKNIQNPIEYAIVRNGGPSAQYFMPMNFGTAHNFGIEAVFTKFFGNFGVSANYTYTKSQITTSKLYFYRDKQQGITTKTVDQTRPLQGQADHIGNLALLYKNHKIGLDVQVAFVYTGKYISQVSPYYQLDYWRLGQGTLDLSFEQRLGKHFSVYGKANNLTNTPSKIAIMQAPAAGNNFPAQQYSDKTVVGKDIYGLNVLAGIRYKF